MQRWVEHYLELYATQNIVTDTDLDAIPDLPVLEELDTPPTLEELSKAIDCLAFGKAPGSDGIPPEALKNSKPALLQTLHELLCLCWDQGHIPQDMHDANIVTVYKNKGDHNDCKNYRGISLLNIVGKAFARVTLVRLQILASRIYPESQCGFRASRSTVDMIFSLHKCRRSVYPESQCGFRAGRSTVDMIVSLRQCRRSVESSRCHSTLPSLTLQRRSNWLAEAVYSGFCRRSAAPQNCWLSSPHFMITCAARFVSIAQHLSPSSSVAESNRVVSWRRRSSASSSPCSSSMP